MNNNGISVVIPNYNGIDLMPKILPPLISALNFTSLPYEIVIVDDCSNDASVSFLKANFPQVLLFENAENKGFSPTVNKGINVAKYDYVLILNSDVILTENYFIPLLRYFEKPDTFGVMGRIVGWEDEKYQDTAKYPSFHGAKIKTTGNYFAKTAKKNDWLYSMYLSGANALVDRKKLVEINGLNEIFAPFYVEDFELSLRAWRLGWKCYYEHFSVCRHQVSVTIKSKSSKNFINTIYYRNKMFLHAIHLTGIKRKLWYLQQIPETMIRLFTGRFYYLRSLSMFIKNRQAVKKSRLEFAALSKNSGTVLSVKEVVTTILESIENRDIERF